MKVLFFNDSAKIAGAEKSLALLVDNLDSTRYQTAVVCPPGDYSAYLRTRDVAVINRLIYYYNRKNGWVRYCKSLAQALKLTREFRADIIHCNSCRSAHWGIPLATLLKVPVVCHIRDCRYTRFSCLLMRHSGAAVRFIAVSEAVRNSLEKAGTHRSRIHVVHNGVDARSFNPEVVPASLEPPAMVRLGVFGRFEERKRVIDAIEALALLPVDLDAHLYIVGDSWTEAAAQVEREARIRVCQNGIENRVTFMGFQQDIPPIMAAMDIILVPSEDEPFARVILEAMALGKPIIGTMSGGTPELLEDCKSGLLLPPRDPAALSKAITRLASDISLRGQLGRNAHSRVQEMFTLTAHVKQVEAVYDLCLA